MIQLNHTRLPIFLSLATFCRVVPLHAHPPPILKNVYIQYENNEKLNLLKNSILNNLITPSKKRLNHMLNL